MRFDWSTTKRRCKTNDKAERNGRLYTLVEVQHRLSVSKTKAHELVATRQLPAIKIGRSLRVREEDLERFIEENRY